MVLDKFLTEHRDDIIERCRAKVKLRSVPPPTVAEVVLGIPLFLDQLVRALQTSGDLHPEIARSAALHGHELLKQGFTISQVVHDYGDVCQSITELAIEKDVTFRSDDFRMLNRCLDDAIAGAVTEYGREFGVLEKERGNERIGFLAHELRNLTQTAMLAYSVMKTGQVGSSGSTSNVLERSLDSIRSLVSRSIEELRWTHRADLREYLDVGAFLQEMDYSLILEAESHGVILSNRRHLDVVMIDVEKAMLMSVVMNLAQNAFKFTKPKTTVTIFVGASDERVLINVQDECGGLPGGDLFRPFEQRSANRTGLGLGLAHSRWGVEANGGRLYAHSIPGEGCVFTADFPRVFAP